MRARPGGRENNEAVFPYWEYCSSSMKRNRPFSRRIGWVSQAGELPNLHTPASHGAISKNPVRRTGKSPPSCRNTRKCSLLGLRLQLPGYRTPEHSRARFYKNLQTWRAEIFISDCRGACFTPRQPGRWLVGLNG